MAYVSSLNLQYYYTAALGHLSSDFNQSVTSPNQPNLNHMPIDVRLHGPDQVIVIGIPAAAD